MARSGDAVATTIGRAAAAIAQAEALGSKDAAK